MKLKDIKGNIGNEIYDDLNKEINKLIFNGIRTYAPELKFNDRFFFGNLHNMKRFLSGKPVGFGTHGCCPEFYYRIPEIRSLVCKEHVRPLMTEIDIETETMHIEVDLVEEYSDWWKVLYSISVKKEPMMRRLSEKYDRKLGGPDAPHTDMLGRKIKIGDTVCYSTSYATDVWLGTVEKFNDLGMVVDGHRVAYEQKVLVVTDAIKIEDNKFRHK